MKISIRAARPDEAPLLTEIACQSKAHWGYSAEQMANWRPAFLTVTDAYIAAHTVWVAAADNGAAVAFAAIEDKADGPTLEHFWVLPAHMGMGIGARLFQHVARRFCEFTFTSDPHADGFYLKLGARKIGEVDSASQGRKLSLFRYRRLYPPSSNRGTTG